MCGMHVLEWVLERRLGCYISRWKKCQILSNCFTYDYIHLIIFVIYHMYTLICI